MALLLAGDVYAQQQPPATDPVPDSAAAMQGMARMHGMMQNMQGQMQVMQERMQAMHEMMQGMQCMQRHQPADSTGDASMQGMQGMRGMHGMQGMQGQQGGMRGMQQPGDQAGDSIRPGPPGRGPTPH